MVSSPAHTVAGIPLLETKLYIPQWRTALVARPRLLARMRQGIARKLTLISAPAGFGKTTLLAEWLAAAPPSERAVGWVSLDHRDNDPAFFWTYFIAALRQLQPGMGERALAFLLSPQPPSFEAVLTTLINEINALDPSTGSGRGFVLVLDDYHVIEAQPIHNAIDFLFDHLPPQMHLIIASRSDPPLPLARLRARGELNELRAADLRFTSNEAAAFLNQAMRLNLSTTEVAALETRTEGWITGLQLAGISLQARNDVAGFISAFTGNDRYIVDYLVDEVLQRQPERVRRFLLQTSILDRLSGPLCDAVRFGLTETPSSSQGTAATGQQDGKSMLEVLERGNLFVVPLDDKREWYRYHHLFADVLQAHAREEHRDEIPILHRRAAAWFENHGMAAEAIEQSRAAGDHEVVARILAANFEDFERSGRYASMSRWFASLPEEMIRPRPRLALLHAAVAMVADNNNQAARRLASWAEAAIQAMQEMGKFDAADDVDRTFVGPEGLDALQGKLLALKLFLFGRKLLPEEIVAIAERARNLLAPSEHRLRGMLHMVDAGMQIMRSDLRSALPNVERSVEEARRTQNLPLLVEMLTLRGQMCAAMARLEDACRSLAEALLVGQQLSAEGNWVLRSPHTTLAEILLERGDLAEATHHVTAALEMAATSPTRSPVLYACAAAAQVFLATSDTQAALEQLELAKAFVSGSSDSRYFSFLSSVRLKIYCRIGDLAAAEEVAQDRKLSAAQVLDRHNEEEMTAYARYLLARGDPVEAGQVLSKVLTVVQSLGRVQHEIHALVIMALANEALDNRALALESLGRATYLAEPGRFNRTFTSEGPVIAELMQEIAADRRDPVAAASPAYLAYLLGEMKVKPETRSQQVTSRAGGLLEPLTVREGEILRLIAAGLRNQAIADQLFISLHTVKRHIANAYGKLGVTHRTEALVRAKELGLL